jgi:hypothetical protein
MDPWWLSLCLQWITRQFGRNPVKCVIDVPDHLDITGLLCDRVVAVDSMKVASSYSPYDPHYKLHKRVLFLPTRLCLPRNVRRYEAWLVVKSGPLELNELRSMWDLGAEQVSLLLYTEHIAAAERLCYETCPSCQVQSLSLDRLYLDVETARSFLQSQFPRALSVEEFATLTGLSWLYCSREPRVLSFQAEL